MRERHMCRRDDASVCDFLTHSLPMSLFRHFVAVFRPSTSHVRRLSDSSEPLDFRGLPKSTFAQYSGFVTTNALPFQKFCRVFLSFIPERKGKTVAFHKTREFSRVFLVRSSSHRQRTTWRRLLKPPPRQLPPPPPQLMPRFRRPVPPRFHRVRVRGRLTSRW